VILVYFRRIGGEISIVGPRLLKKKGLEIIVKNEDRLLHFLGMIEEQEFSTSVPNMSEEVSRFLPNFRYFLLFLVSHHF